MKKIAKKISIVIPAYNEEKAIEGTVEEILKYNKDVKIIVVDDFSTDETLNILKKISHKYNNVYIIHNEKNCGYGGALIKGFFAANTDFIAFMDADLTYPPSAIPKMLEKLESENLDVVWGNRFAGKNESPLVRKVGNRLLSLSFLIFVGKLIPDIACGERLFKKEALMNISPETLPKGLDMITAMTARIVKRKLKYGLVPIDHYKREGVSKLNIFLDFIRMVKNMIKEK